MPIPSPNKGESKKEFIQKCMSDSTMNEEYEQKQRFAICSQKWEDRKKKAAASLLTDNDEFIYFI